MEGCSNLGGLTLDSWSHFTLWLSGLYSLNKMFHLGLDRAPWTRSSSRRMHCLNGTRDSKRPFKGQGHSQFTSDHDLTTQGITAHHLLGFYWQTHWHSASIGSRGGRASCILPEQIPPRCLVKLPFHRALLFCFHISRLEALTLSVPSLAQSGHQVQSVEVLPLSPTMSGRTAVVASCLLMVQNQNRSSFR